LSLAKFVSDQRDFLFTAFVLLL